MARIAVIIGWAIVWVGYFAWNGLHPTSFEDQFGRLLTAQDMTIPVQYAVMATVAIYMACMVNIVNEWERRPVMRFGRYSKTLGPGISFLEPLTYSTLPDVSLQDQVLEVEVENLQTHDNVGISLTAVLTYRIEKDKVEAAVVEVRDIDEAIEERALSTLAAAGGEKELDFVQHNRSDFNESLKQKLSVLVERWGVHVQALEVKDVKINDPDVAAAIALKARATKEGEAELARALIQQQIADALNKAAASYDDKGKWLKGIEVLLEMCRSGNNNTVLIPTDLTEALARVTSFLKA